MNFIVWLWEIKKMLPWDIPKHSMQEYEDEFYKYCELNNLKRKRSDESFKYL